MEKNEQINSLAQQIDSCTRCDLYKGANRSVAGEGSPDAKIVFIGEAPGLNEDKQGRPFVGNAGKYLDLLLSRVGLRREEVFITNVVKHRPPENRDPLPAEITACSAWLEDQLSAISPKIVVTLGKWSLNRYLPEKKISQVHGEPVRIQNTVVIPMYHPAAALRSGQVASQLEEDFQKNKNLLQRPDLADEITEAASEQGQGSLF
jgi:DNA polymerase